MAQRPNILFITTDTQGREMVSAYGQRRGVDTPYLDKFASESVLFENAFVTTPVCTPSRGSWYTGLHPNRHGAWTNNTSTKRAVPMLPELLSDQDYDVAHLGKWHLDGQGKSRASFDQSCWYDKAEFLDEVGREGNKFGGWNRGVEDINYCFGHRVANRAIDYIEKHKDSAKPFFLAVEFDEPHGPYICPPPFYEKFSTEDLDIPATFGTIPADKPLIQRQFATFLAEHRVDPDSYPGHYADYHSCNSYVDYEIGRVLEAASILDNTIIIYTSDHGDHRGAFGLCPKGPTMYDHTLAVPLMIKLPETSEGRRVPGLVSSTDIFMTILDFADIDTQSMPVFKGYSGRSLKPVLSKGQDADRDFVVAEFNRFGIMHDEVNGFWPIRCIRTVDWKLNINLFDSDELYDLKNDPSETTNRINDNSVASIRNDLHDMLLAWQYEAKDTFRSPVWATRPWRENYEFDFEGLITTGYREYAERWGFN